MDKNFRIESIVGRDFLCQKDIFIFINKLINLCCKEIPLLGKNIFFSQRQIY
jgi:hypothetical protein